MNGVEAVEDEQEGGSEQSERADDVGSTTSRLVFEEDGIFLPVVSDFDTRPVAPDIMDPLFWRDALGLAAGDKVTREPGDLAGLFVAGLPKDMD